ncbi:antigen BSP-related family, partial [Trichomonas vaginalis G3]|uniref:uncharacterized protein n=2 Tax=Trichomonas vaginalis (strain ATCC PRA-98 / G3) TaxID=412133 RepID=UPI0021E59CF4
MITFLLLLYKDIDKRFYSSDGKNLTKVNDTSLDLRISSTCEIIQDQCFYLLKTLFSFSFEENPNLTTIGKNSFCGCTNLTTINLSSCKKLTKISSYAFNGCSNVNQILLPEGLLEIGSSAFYSISQMTSIIIPASVEKIHNKVFNCCDKLQNVTFEEGSNLTSLENKVFTQTAITLFQIPEKVSKIHGEAFYYGKLTNISVHPSSNYLTSDGNAVYSKNESILFFICNKTGYEIPDTITTINEYCFSYSTIETLIIPNSVTTIGVYCFHDSHIKTIVLPNSLTSIGDQCFYCTSIETITIPNSTTTIGKYCFILSHIKTIIIPNTVTTLGKFFLLHSRIGIFTIPNSITTIGVQSFYGTDLRTIIIPSSVKRIEKMAFYDCQTLINVTFLGPIDYIGEYVFGCCENLELIKFPNSTMTVRGSGFVTTEMPEVKLSFTCKTLFYDPQFPAFYSIKRNTNVSISYLNESNLIITPDCLIMDSDQAIIYEYWGYFPYYDNTRITIPKSVKKINEKVFENSIIEKFYFTEDSQITYIGKEAFRNCSKIRSFNYSFPYLQTLGTSSFKDCNNLENFTFSSPVLTVMNNAFENCIKLKKVRNITNIPYHCFCGCTNLEEVTIREGSEEIGYKSFENCSSLLSIKIPQSFKIISEYSFLYCKKLKSIIFSETNSLDTFSINSISECESLTNISNFSSEKYKCIDNTLYYKNNNKWELIFHLSSSKDKELNISCDVICSYSFNSSNNIEKINITSDSVSVIEEHSFNNCLNLKYINFPLSVSDVEI